MERPNFEESEKAGKRETIARYFSTHQRAGTNENERRASVALSVEMVKTTEESKVKLDGGRGLVVSSGGTL